MKAKALGVSALPLVVLALGLVLTTAAPAVAIPGPQTTANLRIDCTGSTVCTDGATSLVTNSLSGTFSLSNTGQAFTGTAFVIILEPNVSSFTGNFSFGAGGQSVPFSGGGFTSGFLSDFSSTLGLNSNMYQFSSLASASAQFLGSNATSFFVREWQATNSYSSNGGVQGCCTFGTPTGLVNGSVIIAFAKDAQGNIINTPLSASLTVPEPASLLLLGAGLAGIGLWHRKRRKEMTA